MKKMDIRRLAPADHRVLRDMNEVMVLNVIRENQPTSRIDIATVTGLEGSTVSRIVSRLLEDGLIREEGVAEASPRGGRKKRFLLINPRKALAVGVDLRPGGYAVALSDFTGRILRSVDVPHAPEPQQAAAAIARVVRRVLKYSGEEKVEGIGVGLIGLIEPGEGRMLAAEGLGWGDDVPFGAYLRQALNLELPLYFQNGAWLSALAEIWFGKHARSPRDLVFLDIEEGIGAGVIIRGQLYHGAYHGAGEFGHISLDPNGPPCSCNGRGCLEVFASDPATMRRYRERGGEPDNIAELVSRAIAGEAAAVETLTETATYLGRGLIPVIYSVNPEVIVLGGAITRAWELLNRVISAELSRRTSHFVWNRLSLMPTTLSARPSLLGAIALVLARSFAVPVIGAMGDYE
jgi:predicted NBD/HSP70 family sugar kinase